MRRFFSDTLYSMVTDPLPPQIAGQIDLLRPSFYDAWGGPLNGQQRRREIVMEIAQQMCVDRVIETGTHRGTSTLFFAHVFGVPVESVESNVRYLRFARRRLAGHADVTVSFGDSRQFLRRLADGHFPREETVFIYLDAHWGSDLPLREELEIIAGSWPRAIVMIDDFEVEGDPDYGFDDYGPDARLTQDYLPRLEGWSRPLYPVAAATQETGARRGCCVMASAALSEITQTVTRLRTAPTG